MYILEKTYPSRLAACPKIIPYSLTCSLVANETRRKDDSGEDGSSDPCTSSVVLSPLETTVVAVDSRRKHERRGLAHKGAGRHDTAAAITAAGAAASDAVITVVIFCEEC